MNRRSWKNQHTDIELTSLLDVIFIVLMIVLCNQQLNMQAKTDAAAAQEAEAEAELSEAQEMMEEAVSLQEAAYDFAAEKEMYEEQLKAYEEMQDEVVSIVLYADYKPSDLRTRTVRILSGSAELSSFTLTPGKEQEVFLRVQEALRTEIAENAGKPVIITLSTEKILYRDEESLSEVLAVLSGSCENLYIRKKD